MSELLGVPIDARLVVVLIAVTIAGLLRGFVGFGAALISIPVFSLVLGPHAAIAVNNVMGLPAVFQLLPEAIRRAERPVVLPICIATFVATPIGTWALVAADPALMTVAISALVLLMVVYSCQRMAAQGAHRHGQVDSGRGSRRSRPGSRGSRRTAGRRRGALSARRSLAAACQRAGIDDGRLAFVDPAAALLRALYDGRPWSLAWCSSHSTRQRPRSVPAISRSVARGTIAGRRSRRWLQSASRR